VRPQAGDLVLQKLADSPWVAMASPAQAARLGAVRDWETLPWVGWAAGLEHLPPAQWLAKHVKAPPSLRSNAVGLQLAAVQLGKVALLPVQYARSAALAPVRYAKRLAPSAALWPRDELWLVTHRALRQVPRVRAVWEALAAAILEGTKG
jgi:DNA-binding transcriptional LysR family regulator